MQVFFLAEEGGTVDAHKRCMCNVSVPARGFVVLMTYHWFGGWAIPPSPHLLYETQWAVEVNPIVILLACVVCMSPTDMWGPSGGENLHDAKMYIQTCGTPSLTALSNNTATRWLLSSPWHPNVRLIMWLVCLVNHWTIREIYLLFLHFLVWGMLELTTSLGNLCIVHTQTGLVTSYTLTGHLSSVSCAVLYIAEHWIIIVGRIWRICLVKLLLVIVPMHFVLLMSHI